MNDKSKIIDKIQKLLALSKSPNEHEAALAAEKAQELLATYNIAVSEVEAGEAKTSVIQDVIKTKRSAWQRVVRVSASRMYFCEYYFSTYIVEAPQRKRGFVKYDLHFYVGEPHNIAVAKMMSEYLIDTVWRLARAGARAHPRLERNRYRKAFTNACSRRLQARIFERIQESSRTGITTHEGRNLPALLGLYDQAKGRNVAFIEDNVGKLKSTRSRMRDSHYTGRSDGRDAANTISLDTQVGSDQNSNRQIGGK